MIATAREAQDRILDRILQREGSGYVDDPVDRGGPTKYGITLSTFRYWLGDGAATGADLSRIDEATAREIYRQVYFRGHGFGNVMGHMSVYEHMLDMAVHHGPPRSIKILQKALGVTVDGIIGPETRSSIAVIGDHDLSLRVVGERVLFISRIVRDDPSQSRFLVGWQKRAVSFLRSHGVDI